MSAGGASNTANGGLSANIAAVIQAYEEMEMPVERYLLFAIAPSVGFFVLSLIVAVVAPLPLFVRLPIPGLGLLAVFTAIVYPKIARDQRRAEIQDQLHLFITHLTILSTTNIERVEVFRTLAREQEYKALADEMHKIVQLVDTWNQSLDDACRMRSRQVPSDTLAEFLERLAYVLNAGQELSDFLLSEQEMVLRNYITHYQSSLDNLEVLKDLYLSMIMSMTFALVFATVLPILTGTDPTMMVAAVLILFTFVQAGFVYTMRLMIPDDPLWYHDPARRKRFDIRMAVALVAGLGGVIVVAVLGVASVASVWPFGSAVPQFHQRIPFPFYIAIPVTPLLIPGLILRREERRIRDRDEEFASFIRELGASESVKQSTTSNVLSTLRRRNFGPLTRNIDNLYKRLNIRIDTEEAWRHFAAESRSYLIQKFSEMYVAGRELGGDPKILGELISTNMNEVLQLREERIQSTVTLVGLVYGITAAAAFAFFIGLEVVDVLAALSDDMDLAALDVGQFIYPGVYDMPIIQYLLLAVILMNAMLSAIMIRVADDGHSVNGYVHFVALTWIGATVGWFTTLVVNAFLTVG